MCRSFQDCGFCFAASYDLSQKMTLEMVFDYYVKSFVDGRVDALVRRL